VIARRKVNKKEKCLLVIPGACKCSPVCEEEDEDVHSDMYPLIFLPVVHTYKETLTQNSERSKWRELGRVCAR
jgi:hypothetical protein